MRTPIHDLYLTKISNVYPAVSSGYNLCEPRSQIQEVWGENTGDG